jgi:uncharacterized protein
MCVRRVAAWWIMAISCSATLSAADTQPSLAEAVKAGHRDTVQALLQQRAPVNTPEVDGTTALHWAVRADDVDLTQQLLRAGANVKAANRYGVTPLALAALNGNAALVERLLQAGADPNTELLEGETVLMRAARTGRADAVKVLLAHGAQVNATERSLGWTALLWAAAENHGAAVRVLADAGADLNTRSFRETRRRRIRSRLGAATIMPLPVGAWTPLMYAARQGAVDGARALAEAGADLNLTDPDGTTALVLAIINGHYNLAAMLLDRGADPNVADSRGMSPLYAAVDMHTLPWLPGRPAPKRSDSLDSVELATILLDRGADPNARLKGPILQRYLTTGDVALGSGATPFMRAAKSGDMVMMGLLLKRGADPLLRQTNYTTALILAAGLGFRDNLLDERAVDVGTEQDAIDAITLCLDLGIDIDAFNDDGETAMHAALIRGDRVIKFLAERGATLDMKDRLGRTPLDRALRGTTKEIRGGGVRETTVPLLRELLANAGVQNASRRP